MGPRPLVVVQNNFVTRLTGPVALAAHARGLPLHDVSSGDAARARPVPAGNWSPVLVIGSVLFSQQWAEGRPDLERWIFWVSNTETSLTLARTSQPDRKVSPPVLSAPAG